jgi:hypothetical protein
MQGQSGLPSSSMFLARPITRNSVDFGLRVEEAAALVREVVHELAHLLHVLG